MPVKVILFGFWLACGLVATGACTTGAKAPAAGGGAVATGPRAVPTQPAAVVVRAADGPELTIKELVRRSKPAIVRIVMRAGENGGFGTGFIIDGGGAIVTNLHVIAGADEVEVQLFSGETLKVAHIKAYDVERDLAILSVQPSAALPTLPLADSDSVEAGDPVIAIGNPLGVLDYTVSDGLISSVRAISESLTVLQVTAPISQGSSGGPLFAPTGGVIGVVRAYSSQGQNLNFGIPSNYLHALIARDDQLSLAALNQNLLAALAKAEAEARAAGNGARPGRVQRKVPSHPTEKFKKCDAATLEEAKREIQSAITSGAPIYNQGNHEGCFRIYEGTALKLERESSCQAVRDALGQGMLRASTESTPSLKAWAMRDAFDGILDVIRRTSASI